MLKQIKDFPDYYITPEGQIFSTKTGKWLKQWRISSGYARVDISVNGRSTRKQARVHRLVAEAFLPRVEGKNHINHLNGDKSDNRVENLEWCTNAENARHAAESRRVKRKRVIIDMIHLTDNRTERIEGVHRLAQRLGKSYDSARYILCGVTAPPNGILIERVMEEA